MARLTGRTLAVPSRALERRKTLPGGSGRRSTSIGSGVKPLSQRVARLRVHWVVA